MPQHPPADTLARIRASIETVIVGKSEVVDLLLVCLVSGGHVLIEDVPGLGKTSLVAALAASVDCSFQRIQFTPDVLPSDVTGFHIFDPATGAEKFYPGAVMSQILLADEINRTSPKTQSALLQAMQEGQVTVDGVTRSLPAPFMVCATQNPVELTGTYPLPEAQLDRFLMRISMGYPGKADEVEIIDRNIARARAAAQSDAPAPENPMTGALQPVATAADVLALQAACTRLHCAQSVKAYAVDIAQRTRTHKDIALGISPRGVIALVRAAMGHALLQGRSHVLPDDIQAMAGPVYRHRLVLHAQAYVQNKDDAGILAEIMNLVPVPGTNQG